MGPDLGQPQRLEAECERAVRALLQRTLSETDYRPTGFMRMVTELGAAGAVRALLATDRAPEEFHAGLIRLWELRRLDLSVERFAVHGPCAALFSEEERRRAWVRLDELGHREPS